VGPRAVLDAVVKRKIPSPCRESNPRTRIVQPLATRERISGKKTDEVKTKRKKKTIRLM
jgi:hypothetical protein